MKYNWGIFSVSEEINVIWQTFKKLQDKIIKRYNNNNNNGNNDNGLNVYFAINNAQFYADCFAVWFLFISFRIFFIKGNIKNLFQKRDYILTDYFATKLTRDRMRTIYHQIYTHHETKSAYNQLRTHTHFGSSYAYHIL